jgi:putative transposase
MNYRRSKSCGGTFFFTLVTYKRLKLFEDTRNVNLLRESIQKVKLTHPFKMEAYVLLPDHFHCIWTLPENDNDFSMRWRQIKSYFTRNFQQEKIPLYKARKNKKEQCIWQRRFWEHTIVNEKDFANHVDYIHYNPVKHGYVESPSAWLFSSIHYYIEKGIYSKSWGESGVVDLCNIGE